MAQAVLPSLPSAGFLPTAGTTVAIQTAAHDRFENFLESYVVPRELPRKTPSPEAVNVEPKPSSSDLNGTKDHEGDELPAIQQKVVVDHTESSQTLKRQPNVDLVACKKTLVDGLAVGKSKAFANSCEPIQTKILTRSIGDESHSHVQSSQIVSDDTGQEAKIEPAEVSADLHLVQPAVGTQTKSNTKAAKLCDDSSLSLLPATVLNPKNDNFSLSRTSAVAKSDNGGLLENGRLVNIDDKDSLMAGAPERSEYKKELKPSTAQNPEDEKSTVATTVEGSSKKEERVLSFPSTKKTSSISPNVAESVSSVASNRNASDLNTTSVSEHRIQPQVVSSISANNYVENFASAASFSQGEPSSSGAAEENKLEINLDIKEKEIYSASDSNNNQKDISVLESVLPREISSNDDVKILSEPFKRLDGKEVIQTNEDNKTADLKEAESLSDGANLVHESSEGVIKTRFQLDLGMRGRVYVEVLNGSETGIQHLKINADNQHTLNDLRKDSPNLLSSLSQLTPDLLLPSQAVQPVYDLSMGLVSSDFLQNNHEEDQKKSSDNPRKKIDPTERSSEMNSVFMGSRYSHSVMNNVVDLTV